MGLDKEFEKETLCNENDTSGKQIDLIKSHNAQKVKGLFRKILAKRCPFLRIEKMQLSNSGENKSGTAHVSAVDEAQ